MPYTKLQYGIERDCLTAQIKVNNNSLKKTIKCKMQFYSLRKSGKIITLSVFEVRK